MVVMAAVVIVEVNEVGAVRAVDDAAAAAGRCYCPSWR